MFKMGDRDLFVWYRRVDGIDGCSTRLSSVFVFNTFLLTSIDHMDRENVGFGIALSTRGLNRPVTGNVCHRCVIFVLCLSLTNVGSLNQAVLR